MYIYVKVQYRLGHRETLQLDHRENKAYTLGLSQLLVFIAVAMNTDGFFSYQCIRFIFFMIELQIFSITEPVLQLANQFTTFINMITVIMNEVNQKTILLIYILHIIITW